MPSTEQKCSFREAPLPTGTGEKAVAAAESVPGSQREWALPETNEGSSASERPEIEMTSLQRFKKKRSFQ